MPALQAEPELSKIKKLLSPLGKRKRETQSNEEGEIPMKKLRRSTRVRFQPLKFWENERIRSDPTVPLTMDDIEEKGDALLVKVVSSPSTESTSKLNQEENGIDVIKVGTESTKKKRVINAPVDAVTAVIECESEYQCEPWSEYNNDPYYDPEIFNGSALILDDEEPMVRVQCEENGKLENDDDDEDDVEEELQKVAVRKRIISLPNSVKMKRIGKIYGGMIYERERWKSLFLEIPPQSIFDKEEANQTALFFVHRAERETLKFTLFSMDTDGLQGCQKTFVLSEGAQFYVPKGHCYELENLSKKKRVHLTVTQFKINETL